MSDVYNVDALFIESTCNAQNAAICHLLLCRTQSTSTELARFNVLLKIRDFWDIAPHQPVHILIASFTEIHFNNTVLYFVFSQLATFLLVTTILALYQAHLSLLGLIVPTVLCDYMLCYFINGFLHCS